MLSTEEMRLKSKSQALPVDLSSSSPMIFLAKSGNTHRPSTPQVKSWRPCLILLKVRVALPTAHVPSMNQSQPTFATVHTIAQYGLMEPTTIPGQATTLPHAFTAGTLQDPTTGAWKMDTCMSSHLNDSVTSLSEVFNTYIYPSVSLIRSLHQEFSMTDLGSLNYFLGISVKSDSSGMFLSQCKYVVEILERAHIVNCNPSRTHVDTKSKLGDDGDPVSDVTLYQSLVGSLKYLTFTRPDISYAVQHVCLYMHDPREPHFSVLKRILLQVLLSILPLLDRTFLMQCS
nr:ribonuclease H-like domain-containing protein [Tanacetum cinerariifolium]